MFDLSLAYRTLRAMSASLVASLPRLGAALLIILVSMLLARVVRWGTLRALRPRKGHESLRLAFARLAFAAVIAVSLLFAATVAVPSFTVGSLIQLLGVSGVVVGFAFKDIFQNFLAGILILLTNPFAIGDQIQVDAYEGTVEEIQARATLIRTYDRRRVVVPNADLFTKSVIVNTAFPLRRMMYDLVVTGDVEFEKVRDLLTSALNRGIQGVERDPVAEVLLTHLGAGNMTLRLLWWSGSERASYLIVQDRVLATVRSTLKEAGIVAG